MNAIETQLPDRSDKRFHGKEANAGVRLLQMRDPQLNDHQKREAIKRRDYGEAVREIARSYGTISRLQCHV
jgi:hypothetical protein